MMKRLRWSWLFGIAILMAGCETPLVEGLNKGNLCPEIAGEDVDDKPIRLSDYKGKVVLVEFWGTWCPACRSLLTHEARKVTQDYRDRPFVMIGIADDTKDILKEFFAVKPLPWANIVDHKQLLSKQWNVDSFPTFVLIDQHGIIRGRWFNGVTREAPEVWKEVEQYVQQAEVK